MIRTYSVRVSGKVQGVFFRASAREKARALGINGFVRNERDGNVFIEAEGEEDQLGEFLSWCRQGPPRARVESCEIREIESRKFSDFEIDRG